MPSIRDIMINRAKEPAKVHPLDRPLDGPGHGQGYPGLQSEAAVQVSALPPVVAATRPPRPKAASRPGVSPASASSVSKPSEGRRPRPGSEPSGIRRSPSEPASRADADDGTSSRGGRQTEPRAKARSASLMRIQMGDAPPPLERKDVGKVPAYLRKRQDEMAEEKRRAARPVSPQPPPGFRKVGEEERDSTLSVLRQRKSEVEKAQQNLPFKIETLGQKQREKELETRLGHLDKLIGMFSKPLVFVPADAEPITNCPGPEIHEERAPPPREQERAPRIQELGGGHRGNVRTEVKVSAPPGGASSLNLGWS